MQLTPPRLLLGKVVDSVVSGRYERVTLVSGGRREASRPIVPFASPSTIPLLRIPVFLHSFYAEIKIPEYYHARVSRRRKNGATNVEIMVKTNLSATYLFKYWSSRFKERKEGKTVSVEDIGRKEQMFRSGRHNGMRLVRTHWNSQSVRDPLRTRLEIGGFSGFARLTEWTAHNFTLSRLFIAVIIERDTFFA